MPSARINAIFSMYSGFFKFMESIGEFRFPTSIIIDGMLRDQD